MSQQTIRIPSEELVCGGHLACPGCGGALALRYALKALGPKTVLVMPACCAAATDGPWPFSAVSVPLYHTAFETAASCATGVKAGLEMRGDTETTVVAWAGDGGTFDIGLQSLSGAAERNEDILYVCYDNEAYMNTGVQRSSATPFGAWTTTTPQGLHGARSKKHIMEIIAAHRVPYAATATVAFPDDLVAKVLKAKGVRGFRFLHVLAPCPPGWKSPPELTVTLARLAVESRLFPLYEIEDGVRLRLTHASTGGGLREYLASQDRFRGLDEGAILEIERRVRDDWERLMTLAASANTPELRGGDRPPCDPPTPAPDTLQPVGWSGAGVAGPAPLVGQGPAPGPRVGCSWTPLPER